MRDLRGVSCVTPLMLVESYLHRRKAKWEDGALGPGKGADHGRH